jgi:transcriptional regulator with XRE-family HTH domain
MMNPTIDEASARRLGERLQRHRLNRNVTQAQLAEAVGVSRPAIIQLEKGEGKLSTFMGALRALGLLDQLDVLVPEVPLSPVQLARLEGKTRQRARHARKAGAGASPVATGKTGTATPVSPAGEDLSW